MSGEPGAQGTQMDAIGHFAVLPQNWDGKAEFPSDRREILRRLYAEGRQADAGFAAC